jgi:hypothetical protein
VYEAWRPPYAIPRGPHFLVSVVPYFVIAWSLQKEKPTIEIMESIISCPLCGYKENKTIPVDQCLFFNECQNCHTVLRPKPGDCCVFCSYGSVPCLSAKDSFKLNSAMQTEEILTLNAVGLFLVATTSSLFWESGTIGSEYLSFYKVDHYRPHDDT